MTHELFQDRSDDGERSDHDLLWFTDPFGDKAVVLVEPELVRIATTNRPGNWVLLEADDVVALLKSLAEIDPSLLEAAGLERYEVTPGTVDGEVATCARCGREIAWEFDNDEDPYGVWSSEDTLHSCTPGPKDEDRWHTPAPEREES